MAVICEKVLPDLEIVENLVQKELNLRSGPVTKFIDLKINNFEKNIYSLLIFSFFRFFGKPNIKAYAMAAVFQFIYLADLAHQEDGEYIHYEVLIGDFLFSKFFFFMCKYDLLEWLPSIASLLCQRQEAYVLKLSNTKNPSKILEIIDMEKARLYGECCYIGAKLAEGREELLELAKDFGLYLGRAHNLLAYHEYLDLAAYYLEQAKKILNFFPDGESKDNLNEILNFFELELQSSCSEINKVG